MAPRPTNEEKFSFGLWTVGWQGRHQFGDAVGGDRGYGFVRRNESALERLLGAR